jgi:hypothetical protein
VELNNQSLFENINSFKAKGTKNYKLLKKERTSSQRTRKIQTCIKSCKINLGTKIKKI